MQDLPPPTTFVISMLPVMRCGICNLFQGRWPIDAKAASNQHVGQGVRSLVVPKIRWEDFLKSAKDCYGCSIIVRGCRGVFKQHDVSEQDIVHGSIRFYYPAHLEDVEEADCDKHIIFQLATGRTFEVELFATEDEDCPVPDAWDYMATLSRTSPRTDSSEALNTIQDWIVECTEDHTDSLCDMVESPTLPKRVVDVGSDNNSVRLIEPNGLEQNYICLSHCWGLEQIITTTMTNLDDHKQSISWKGLSNTFQDAITLTRTLGFRYIWIDSLCIIQDSTEDWQVESAKMASIYSNGYLTIAGTKSRNGLGGLFSSTPDYRVAGTTPEGEKYCLYFRERIDHQIDNILESAGMTSSEKYYPLLSRAWVYQERMLSTRVLHFGRYELFFECKSTIQCECGTIRFHGAGTETPVPLIKVGYAGALEAYDQCYKADALEKVQYHGARLWRSMVSCYTALRLTKSKDRLPAFGGLARQMASKRKTRYLAGLWEDALIDDSLWTLYTPSKLKCPRPEPRNAPTWSWASVESAAGVGYYDTILFTDLEDEGLEDRMPHVHYSKIEGCNVVGSAIDEFGGVASGELSISGLVVEGVLGQDVHMHEGDETFQHLVKFGDVTKPMDSDYLLAEKGSHQVRPGTKVCCLCMSMLQLGQKDYLFSLVLKESSLCTGRFERIGMMKIAGPRSCVHPDSTIFRGADVRTVTIV
ncbi:hypothetical protein HBI23_050860 [Parastagonospora nodorum]|nr:hypothetical protein HBI71_017700 [Parastagonospora nodorum]KAH5336612.1 hypothetical protein HBI12_027800 [Parastagonospora nodorum]KAH5686080.1 hypothetical protein HBI23_050860 [Parastagonospora nodorum]